MMRTILPALCLAAMAVPAQAQDQAPSSDPYRDAVAARLAGDPARAAALLGPVVATDPRNADAQVQLGLAQLALANLDEAERAFNAALAVAPDYADARIGLARVAQRRGDRSAALRALGEVDPANGDAADLRRQLAAQPVSARWQLDVDAAYSWLDGPQPDWRELAIGLRRQLGERTALGGRVEYARRFAIDDVYGEVQVDHRLSDAARLYASFGATADPDFRPEWQLGLGGSLRVHDGPQATVLTLDARQSRFAAGDVQTVSPGVEQYIGGRFWLTGRWINIFDEGGSHRSGYMLRGDVQASDAARLFVGYSDAADTDEGVVIDVRSLFGGVNVDLGSRSTLRLSAAHDDRAIGADRTQLSLGLGFRF